MAKWIATPFLYVGYIIGFVCESFLTGYGAGAGEVQHLVAVLMEKRKNG